MESSIKQRDYTWDVLKFILIVLVILGHYLLNNLGGNSVNRIVYNFRGLFTMPLFVFISGYFSRKKEKERFFRQVLHLIETYIIVEILYVSSAYFILHKTITLNTLLIPDYSAWFLLSLIYWRVMLQIIPEKWLKSKLIIPVCLVVSLASGFIPLDFELSIQRTLAFSPFFFAGYLLNRRIEFTPITCNNLKNNKIRLICVSVIIAVFICTCVFLNRDISNIIWCAHSYYLPNGSTCLFLLLRAAFLVIAAVLVFCILKSFPKQKVSFVSSLGADTMYYYVYHVLVIRVGMVFIHRLHLPLSFPAMLCYTLLTVAMIYFLVKIKFFRMLLNPISSLIEKRSV